MDVLLLHGVPYWTNMNNELFLYGSNPPQKIGVVEGTPKTPVLMENWKEKANDWLKVYRATLYQNTLDQKAKKV